jgi:hypothetical protein
VILIRETIRLLALAVFLAIWSAMALISMEVVQGV